MINPQMVSVTCLSQCNARFWHWILAIRWKLLHTDSSALSPTGCVWRCLPSLFLPHILTHRPLNVKGNWECTCSGWGFPCTLSLHCTFHKNQYAGVKWTAAIFPCVHATSMVFSQLKHFPGILGSFQLARMQGSGWCEHSKWLPQ